MLPQDWNSCRLALPYCRRTRQPHIHISITLRYLSLSLSLCSSPLHVSFHVRSLFNRYLYPRYVCNGQRSSLFTADENVSGKRANGRPPVHIYTRVYVYVCVGGSPRTCRPLKNYRPVIFIKSESGSWEIDETSSSWTLFFNLRKEEERKRRIEDRAIMLCFCFRFVKKRRDWVSEFKKKWNLSRINKR